jgi:hypothetical protein
MIGDTSFSSLRGAKGDEAIWVAAIEIATPRQVGARNDMGGYDPTLQTYKVSPIYLN